MRFQFPIGLLISVVAAFQSPAQSANTSAAATNLTLSLRVAGSIVVDFKGEPVGNIESVFFDPRTSQIEFAMVSTEYPSNRFVVTPMPWQMLQYRWDARAAGGVPGTFQQLLVPMDKGVVARAPRIDSEQSAATNDLAWMSASYNYFQAAMGGVGAASAMQTGSASEGATTTPSPAPANSNPYPYLFFGGGGFVGDGIGSLEDFLILGTNLFGSNFLSGIIGTNSFATNAAGTNFLTSSNLFASLTNFFATNAFNFTNSFATNQLGSFRSNLFRNFLNTNFFGSNLPGFVSSNFFSPGPTNFVRTFPATNRIPLPPPPAAGAPPSGSGVNAPNEPVTPTIPPTVPSAPMTPWPRPNPLRPG